jgi:hypothetical protein
MHAANVGSWRDGMLRIPSARPGRRLTLAVAHRAAACEHRRMPDPEIPATRWLFADQLGPWYLDRPGQPVLLIESLAKLGRRRFHRQKLHLVLSALRHRPPSWATRRRCSGRPPTARRWTTTASR